MTSIRLPKSDTYMPTGLLRLMGYFRSHLNTRDSESHRDSKSGTVEKHRQEIGSVLLVGAGPGDPDLLTIKALKALQQADVVLVDWLVSKAIVDLIPSYVETRFVGKRAGHHSMSQDAISTLMVTLACQGNKVVRLKGGDPAVFGRTAEEAVALEKAGIQFAIIPGITAASGASASSGIPLTHRACAQSVRMLTAHLKDPVQEPDWKRLVAGLESETQVFYMGLTRLNQIMNKMIVNGMSESMPVAVVDQATTPEQRICYGTASYIVDEVLKADFRGPSLIILGHAVAKRFAVSKEVAAYLAEVNVSI